MSCNVLTPLVSSSGLSFILYIATIQIFSVIGLPITKLFFKKWLDSGYIFSRLIGFVVVTYIAWLGASLNIFPYNQLSLIVTVIFLLIFFSVTTLLANRKIHLRTSLTKSIIIEEILFFLFFISFLMIRWKNPDLWHPVMGGEKPMDFAFINSMVRSQHIPPIDPWFSGESINYYYFGQLLVATITKIINIAPSISYNLTLAFIFAQTAVSVFSLVSHFSKNRYYGLFASFFLVICGNLAQIPLIVQSLSTKLPINAWYWTASRVMLNNEINEFPFFSFLYADLHSHLISLPIIVLIISCLLSFNKSITTKLSDLLKFIFISFLIGFIRACNVWDFPTYYLFTCIVLSFSLIRAKKYFIIKSLLICFLILLLSTSFISPFLSNFKTGPLGINLYNGPKTRLTDYLIINGLFVYLFISYLVSIVVLIVKKLAKKRDIFLPLFLYMIAFGLTIIPETVYLSLGLGRINMVFKYYFQAWIFFAISSAISLKYIYQSFSGKHFIVKTSWSLLFFILFTSTLVYPVTATPAKMSDRISQLTPPTLDGMLYMKNSYYSDNGQNLNLAWDYDAINWLNRNIENSPVILEANTPVYRWGSRVSIYTGLPTVIGWDWHETAHRSYLVENEIATRLNDVKNAYNTLVEKDLFKILDKYKVEYIYIGELERAYYNPDGLKKFDDFVTENKLELVFQNTGVVIYHVIVVNDFK